MYYLVYYEQCLNKAFFFLNLDMLQFLKVLKLFWEVSPNNYHFPSIIYRPLIELYLTI